MRAAIVKEFGRGLPSVQLVRQPPTACGAGRVRVTMLASPINPSDLLELDGAYAASRKPPFIPGAEGCGRIAEVGPDVSDFSIGDLVLCMTRGNWTSERDMPASELLRLPSDVPVLQAAMLRVNVATAALLLEHAAHGDKVIFNAANSAVGQLMLKMAARHGLQMIAVARNADSIQKLEAAGATCAVADNDELVATIRRRYPEGADIAFDCVAGAASAKLANSLRPGGSLIVYGHLSGAPCEIPSALLTFGGLKVSGLNLARALAGRTVDDTRMLYEGLANELAAGHLHTEISSVVPLSKLAEAINVARSGTAGKIVLQLDA